MREGFALILQCVRTGVTGYKNDREIFLRVDDSCSELTSVDRRHRNVSEQETNLFLMLLENRKGFLAVGGRDYGITCFRQRIPHHLQIQRFIIDNQNECHSILPNVDHQIASAALSRFGRYSAGGSNELIF